jgi:hypothetical protein
VHLTPRERVAANREASRIYAAAGVRLDWVDGFETWRAPDGQFHAAVVILNRAMGELQIRAGGVAEGALGVAVRSARRTYIFYERIVDLLSDESGSVGNMLGMIIAHELGHLMLPPGSHSDDGIMRSDVARLTTIPQFFTEDQSAVIRRITAGASTGRSEYQNAKVH